MGIELNRAFKIKREKFGWEYFFVVAGYDNSVKKMLSIFNITAREINLQLHIV